MMGRGVSRRMQAQLDEYRVINNIIFSKDESTFIISLVSVEPYCFRH